MYHLCLVATSSHLVKLLNDTHLFLLENVEKFTVFRIFGLLWLHRHKLLRRWIIHGSNPAKKGSLPPSYPDTLWSKISKVKSQIKWFTQGERFYSWRTILLMENDYVHSERFYSFRTFLFIQKVSLHGERFRHEEWLRYGTPRWNLFSDISYQQSVGK